MMQEPHEARGRRSFEDRAVGLIHQFGKDLCWIRSTARSLQGSIEIDQVEAGAKIIQEVAQEMANSARRLLEDARGDGQLWKVMLSDAVDAAIARAGRLHPTALLERAPGPEEAQGGRTVPKCFEEALFDVLDNAARATTASEPIRVELIDGGRHGVRVRDLGAGMSHTILSICTRRGFTTRASNGGHGIGLSHCAAILESMGGRLELESALGRGTVATLWLD